MGWKYEVCEWTRDITNGEDYRYKTQWTGDSFLLALWNVYKLKRNGAGAVSLIVR